MYVNCKADLVSAKRQNGYGDKQVGAGQRDNHPVGQRAHLTERSHRSDDERVADDDADDDDGHQRSDDDHFDEWRSAGADRRVAETKLHLSRDRRPNSGRRDVNTVRFV